LLVIKLDDRNGPTLDIEVMERNATIQVEVVGAVFEPGVYAMERGDRVNDLVDAAGGVLEDGDTSSLNLAQALIDGQRVSVPFAPASTVNLAIASPETHARLDINRATAEDLMRLPGIGEVRANAIVAFRNQNGPFTAVAELMFVDGISEGVFEEIRPFITVGQ
jgi:competence protein ComEA